MSFWRGVGVATLCTLGASFYVVGEVVEFKPPFAFDPTMESLPPMRTCASGSPAANRPFCNQGKTHDERAQLLAEDLTQEELIILWALHSYHYPIPRLNIKGLHRDTCCVHGAALNYMDGPWVGVEPKYVTVFPHAINHGATWDLDLVARLANATGNEMRAASQIRYRTSGGQAYAAVICDSGPLANTAHHPAWGRISETYGEDPVLVSRIGSTVTSVMQARDAGVLRTALTTRHYMGYHKTNTMPVPTMEVSERDLYDAYLPGYHAFAVEGGAEGIMCGFSSFDGIPSCANSRLLKNILHGEWKSDSIVQSDCCDSLTAIKSQHNYTETYEEAIAAGFSAGLDLCFGCDPNIDHGPSGNASNVLASALSQGLVTLSQLKAAVARIMLTRFRLGEFDEGPNRPWATVDESLLDSPAHRALAREAASASTVMAYNACDAQGCTLPFQPSWSGDKNGERSIAVLGQFANCTNVVGGGWAKTSCYLHSYAGIPSNIVNILDAVHEDARALGATVKFAAGATLDSAAINEAVDAATAAELTILTVGTGNLEAEGRDRLNLTLPPDQESLLAAVASAVAKTGGRLVVVCISAGPVYIDPTVAGVGAVLYAGYGGEEAGHGVTDIIFGRVCPSARFPLTVYDKNYLDLVGPVSDFSSTSGVGRTYRYLNVTASPPLYYFGHGLSYSRFEYSDLSVTLSQATSVGHVTVNATVKNVGSVSAQEVVQVYVANPGAGAVAPALPVPLRSLLAFSKPQLLPGKSTHLSFTLPVSQFATVQTNGSSVITGGVYTVSVGGRQPADTNKAGVAQGNILTDRITLPHILV